MRTKERPCQVVTIVSKDRAVGGRTEGRVLSSFSLCRSACFLLIENKHPGQSMISIKMVSLLNCRLQSINFSQTHFEITSSLPRSFLKGRGNETIFNGPFSSKQWIVFRIPLRDQKFFLFNGMSGKATVGAFISPDSLDFKL